MVGPVCRQFLSIRIFGFSCHQGIDNNSLIYQIGNAAPPMWSISTEWFFYLCYPVIMLPLIRATRPRYAIAGAVIWSLAWGSIIPSFFLV